VVASEKRVALVTGAARGIGKGIALRLAADGLDVAAGFVSYLASPDSGYLTGRSVVIDGGIRLS